MILKYGTYTHDDNECALVITKTNTLNDAGIPWKTTERWEISGQLNAASQSALTTALTALSTAYSTQGLDLTLYENDGVTPSAHQIISSSTIGGTRVVNKPQFPTSEGAEYTTYRKYTLAVEADYYTTAAGSNILAWEETLTFTGTGGPRTVIIELRNGPPQRQIVSQQTAVEVRQTGRAVGRLTYPRPSSPIWPGFENQWSRGVSYGAPKTFGEGTNRTLTEYSTTWEYTFTAPSPLAAYPSNRPQS